MGCKVNPPICTRLLTVRLTARQEEPVREVARPQVENLQECSSFGLEGHLSSRASFRARSKAIRGVD